MINSPTWRWFALIVYFQLSLYTPLQAAQPIDQIAIIVDDQSILSSEVEQRYTELKGQIAQQGAKAPPKDILLPQLMERMILESIQDQMAARYQIKVSDDDVNDALTRIAKRDNMTFNQYMAQLRQSDQSPKQVRAQIERELKHYQLQQRMLANRIQITDQDIKTFLNSNESRENQNVEYKIRHILLQISERASPQKVQEKKAQALALIQAIKNKENTFEETAIAVSDDSFALKGGDMGWRRISQIPSRFTSALAKLKPKQISEPIRSPSGFHILYLEETRGQEEVLVERAKIEHILIKPNQVRSAGQAEQLALDLRQRMVEVTSLNELARTFSDDPGSALSGGELGWVNLESLDPKFAQQAQIVKINELSPVFRSQFGFHILRVLDRKKEDMSKNLRSNRAKRWLEQRAFEENLPAWLSEIRADAYVEFKPPFKALVDKARP